VIDSRKNGRNRQHLDPGRCQLDGEGQAVQPTTQLADLPRVVLAQAKGRLRCRRPSSEEVHGFRMLQFAYGHLGAWELERREGIFMLARDVQPRPARHDHLESGCGGEERRQVGRRAGDVLEVVQHRQDLTGL
jgi:hypothetical protein